MNKTVVRKMYEDFMFDGKPKTWDEYLEMEKQQIIDAFELWRTGSGEQYYKETYGSNGSDENFKQFSLYEHKETIATSDTPTSHQIEISEHRFTEKDIRFAYMQGYNRGVDGNPNHMESYIEHLKSTKLSQTEISDDEIEKASCDQATFAPSFIAGAKWYREQLQNKNI